MARYETLFGQNKAKLDLLLQKSSVSQQAQAQEKDTELLMQKLSKLKKKRDAQAKAIRELRQRNQKLLLELESRPNDKEQQGKEGDSLDLLSQHQRASSLNNFGARAKANDNALNQTFNLPQMEAISTCAFNPNEQSVSRNQSLSQAQKSRKYQYGDLSFYDNDSDQHSAKVGRQENEIELLNREINVLKSELLDKHKEQKQVVDSYERDLRLQSVTSSNIISGLRQNLTLKE